MAAEMHLNFKRGGVLLRYTLNGFIILLFTEIL